MTGRQYALTLMALKGAYILALIVAITFIGLGVF